MDTYRNFKRPTFSNKAPARATSPTFSATTDASQMDLSSVETIITRKDLRHSIQAYDDLVNACCAYRKALVEISRATSSFASAMDVCSRLKGVTDETGVNFQAAGGLHYLMANHWEVLVRIRCLSLIIPLGVVYEVEYQSHTLEQQFEEPLRKHVSQYKTAVVERSTGYERVIMEKSKSIRQTEAENLNIGKKKRDLQSFRQALSILQAELDELDRLKVAHYQEVLDHEQEMWDVVSGKVCLVVRSSLEVFDKITSKSTDSVLETMVQSIPDPFDSYGPPKKEGQLFSILTPLMTPGADTGTNSNYNTGPGSTEPGLVELPRTDTTTFEWEGVSTRIRRQSSPITATSSHTGLSLLTPTPLRHTSMPTILTVIDESRGRQESQLSTADDDGSPVNSPTPSSKTKTLPDFEEQVQSLSSSRTTSDTNMQSRFNGSVATD